MEAKNKKQDKKCSKSNEQDKDRFNDVPFNFGNIIRTAVNYDPKGNLKEKKKRK